MDSAGGSEMRSVKALRDFHWYRCANFALTVVACVCDGCGGLGTDHTSHLELDNVPQLLDDKPILQIGVVDGPPEYLFRGIASVRITPDSLLVVVDRRANIIRIFDRAGRHIRSFGRVGAGPEEFQALWDAWLNVGGDTIVAWDVLGHRTSEWSVPSGFVRTQRLPIDFQPVPLGRFRDGSLLVVRKEELRPAAPGGVAEIHGVVYRMSLDASEPVQLLRQPWEAVAAGVDSRDGVGALYVAQPFRSPASVAVGDSTFYVTDGARYVIHQYAMDGTFLDSMALSATPPAIMVAERDTWINDGVAGTPAALRPGVRRFLTSLTIPDSHPAFVALKVDEAGHVWARLGSSGPDSTSIWAVFDSRGEHVGTTSMPPRFNPSVIGNQAVVGTQRGALDVESVTLLPIIQDPRR
jgi:sugar lactone lactonase YvrE